MIRLGQPSKILDVISFRRYLSSYIMNIGDIFFNDKSKLLIS
jgi:hypothetical protein